jgi:hypothetical protein
MGAGELQGAQPARPMAVAVCGGWRLLGVVATVLADAALDGRLSLLAFPPQGIEPGTHVGARPPPFIHSKKSPCCVYARAPISGPQPHTLRQSHSCLLLTGSTHYFLEFLSPHAQGSHQPTNQTTQGDVCIQSNNNYMESREFGV